MKGIEKITARIEADAQAEVEEILRSAREKAEEIRACLLYTSAEGGPEEIQRDPEGEQLRGAQELL